MPGVCTDAETIEEGMIEIKDALKAAIQLYIKQKEPVPEPIDKKKYKGNIAYRTTPDRHYRVAQFARRERRSLSKTMDEIVDAGIASLASS